jgi:hypothetical protein
MSDFLLLALAVLCINAMWLSAIFYVSVKLGFLPGVKWTAREHKDELKEGNRG